MSKKTDTFSWGNSGAGPNGEVQKKIKDGISNRLVGRAECPKDYWIPDFFIFRRWARIDGSAFRNDWIPA
jgi:hypothetical protein